MPKRSRKATKTPKRLTSPPPSASRASNSGLNVGRLERLRDRVAKFNANIIAIKASIENDREA